MNHVSFNHILIRCGNDLEKYVQRSPWRVLIKKSPSETDQRGLRGGEKNEVSFSFTIPTIVPIKSNQDNVLI